jgi:hypothetical protein
MRPFVVRNPAWGTDQAGFFLVPQAWREVIQIVAKSYRLKDTACIRKGENGKE